MVSLKRYPDTKPALSGAIRTRLFSASRRVKLGYNVDMRRWLSIATFSLILLALPLWAQRRGGGGGGGAHFASRGGSAVHSSGVHSSGVHSSGMHSSGIRSAGSFRGGSFGRGSGIRIRTGNPYYNRRGFYGRRGYTPMGATRITGTRDIIPGAITAGTMILSLMTRTTKIRIRMPVALIRVPLILLPIPRTTADCSAMCRR